MSLSRIRSASIGCLALILVLAIAPVFTTAGPKFYPDDPLQREPESRDASSAKSSDIGLVYEIAMNLFVVPQRKPSNILRTRGSAVRSARGRDRKSPIRRAGCAAWCVSGRRVVGPLGNRTIHAIARIGQRCSLLSAKHQDAQQLSAAVRALHVAIRSTEVRTREPKEKRGETRSASPRVDSWPTSPTSAEESSSSPASPSTSPGGRSTSPPRESFRPDRCRPSAPFGCVPRAAIPSRAASPADPGRRTR